MIVTTDDPYLEVKQKLIDANLYYHNAMDSGIEGLWPRILRNISYINAMEGEMLPDSESD